MIKNVLICLFVLLCSSRSGAQPPSTNTIAPFSIVLQDGKSYHAGDLKKNTPVILVYFAPDCEHCAKFAKDLTAHDAALKNKQVVMITYFPVAGLVNFDKTYGLSSHANIKIGTEGLSFIVRKYYNIMRFPFIVLYNSQGKEVKRFTEETPFQILLDAFTGLR